MRISKTNRRTILKVAFATTVALGSRRMLAAQEVKDVPWLAEIQMRPAKVSADAPALRDLLVDSRGRPITSLAGWQARRDELRRWWLDFLGPMPAERRAAPSLTVIDEDRPEGVIRQLVRYEVEPGIETEAYLLKPQRPSGKSRGIAVFHSTVSYTIRQPSGLEGPPEKHFGLRYAKKGCVCFCPRNFLWPKNAIERLEAMTEVRKLAERSAKSKGMAKMLYDALVAVDILAAQPEVDPQRIGSVGHSLGAKETLYLAAFDERVKVTVSSEGGVGTKFSNWDAPWYLGPTIKEPSFTHEHHELLALAAPRPFLLVGGNSADGDSGWPFIAAAREVYQLYGEPARVGQFNHAKGHAVPPEAEERIEEWLMTYL